MLLYIFLKSLYYHMKPPPFIMLYQSKYSTINVTNLCTYRYKMKAHLVSLSLTQYDKPKEMHPFSHLILSTSYIIYYVRLFSSCKRLHLITLFYVLKLVLSMRLLVINHIRNTIYCDLKGFSASIGQLGQLGFMKNISLGNLLYLSTYSDGILFIIFQFSRWVRIYFFYLNFVYIWTDRILKEISLKMGVSCFFFNDNLDYRIAYNQLQEKLWSWKIISNIFVVYEICLSF